MRHPSQSLLLLSALFGLFAEEANARRSYTEYACGNRVVFDCDHHVATMGNIRSPLDCGVSTPSRKHGFIRGTHIASGSRWRCLRGQRTADIGLGAVLVHAPCGGRSPKGQNQHFRHSGCLNVTARLKDAILNCRGASYEIRYASKASFEDNGRIRYARRQQSPRAYGYAQNSGYGYQQRQQYDQVAQLFGGEGWRD